MNPFAKVCAVIVGILMIVMGVWMCATPVVSLLGLALYMTIALLVYGIYEIYLFCAKTVHSSWVLASGIISALLGIWLLFSDNAQEAVVIAIPFIFAFWVMIGGINRAVGSFALKNVGASNWGWMLAIGIVGIICGFALMFSPVVSALTLSFVIGFSFIWQGIAVACLTFIREGK